MGDLHVPGRWPFFPASLPIRGRKTVEARGDKVSRQDLPSNEKKASLVVIVYSISIVAKPSSLSSDTQPA
jgi:hypothetical protein